MNNVSTLNLEKIGQYKLKVELGVTDMGSRIRDRGQILDSVSCE